ncbi:MAG: apolipoprotein N-acyltransferase [Armatimonadetes bacterium]|nr:apolipoprotein N-acyltransferase [Armatimonadota bacterium]
MQADISLAQKKSGPADELLERHMALTRAAPAADLYVWPETAVPARLTWEPTLLGKLAAGARERGATLVVGSVEPLPGPYRLGAQGNAAFIFGPDGRLLEKSWKVHLVLFGEYLPGRELPLLRKLAPLTPQFTAGRRLRAVDTPVGRVGIPICFEGIFGADTRAMVRDGAEAFLLLTNDDQLCEIGARQHYQQSVFRAVETRRWVARCANGGISAFIEPTGVVTGATDWHQATVHVGGIRMRDDTTFYVRHGNWFPVLCLLATFAFLLAPAGVRPRARTGEASEAADEPSDRCPQQP